MSNYKTVTEPLGQPWLTDRKWAGGQIVDDNRSGMVATWVFAAIWNAIAWPVAIAVLLRAQPEKQLISLTVLVFPMVGLLLAFAAFRQTMRHKRFGVSVLKLNTMPASPGMVVAGTISVPTAFNGAAVHIRLYCTHRRETGNGKDRRTHESTLWEDEREIRSANAPGGTGTAIAFQFNLPANVPATDNGNLRDQRLWRIAAKAELPGIDYSTRFEIPVYVTEASNAASSEASVPLPEPAIAKPTEPGLTAAKRIDGGWDIHFAAGRNKGAAGIVGMIGVIFTGVGVGVGYFAQVYFFGALFGLVGLACLVGLWQMLLAQSALTVSRGTIKVRKWSPVYSSTKNYSAEQIENVTFKITSQFGDKPYYSVRIHPKGGHALSAGSGISSKHDARWIAERLRESLRLTETSDPEEISDL